MPVAAHFQKKKAGHDASHGIPNRIDIPLTRETGGSRSGPGGTPLRRTGRTRARGAAGGGRRRRRATSRTASARRRPRAGPRAGIGPATPPFPSRRGGSSPPPAADPLPLPLPLPPRRPTPRPSSVTKSGTRQTGTRPSACRRRRRTRGTHGLRRGTRRRRRRRSRGAPRRPSC